MFQVGPRSPRGQRFRPGQFFSYFEKVCLDFRGCSLCGDDRLLCFINFKRSETMDREACEKSLSMSTGHFSDFLIISKHA